MTKNNTSLVKTLRLAGLFIVLCLVTLACKKEFDSPPIRTLPVGQVMTVAQLRGLFTGLPKRFAGDSSVYAVVTADEDNGNLYKNIYIQDHTGAIVMRLLNSGGLYQGDSIRIYLPGTVLSSYSGMLQLDSVDVDNNVVKQATQVYKAPQLVTLPLGPELQGRLVRLENVQFVASDTSATYADAINQATVNRTLENCNGAQAIVRSSGFSNFASLSVPNGKGSFVGVVGQFQSDMQLFIRDLSEVQLTGPRCGQSACTPVPALTEQFNDAMNNVDVDIECWLNVFTQGSRKWKGIVAGGESYAEAKPPSFSGVNEAWLVSAPITYTAGMNLSFSSALGGTWLHDGLSVKITTTTNLNSGTDVLNATWTTVTGATLAGSGSTVGTWVPSGSISLSPYLSPGQAFVIGFDYVGAQGTTSATPYRIDNVMIQ